MSIMMCRMASSVAIRRSSAVIFEDGLVGADRVHATALGIGERVRFDGLGLKTRLEGALWAPDAVRRKGLERPGVALAPGAATVYSR